MIKGGDLLVIKPALVHALILAAALATAADPPASGAHSPVSFDEHIRPILSDNCFTCHGPDAQTRKANLRLDDGIGAFETLTSGTTPVVPGDRTASAIWARITAADPVDRMPPASVPKTLSPDQIELLGQWIDEGAQWEKHWSFEPVGRVALPEVEDSAWPRNGIDHFVLARLEREGLTPSAEADKRTLIRRVTLDLTGLPPALDDVEAFVNDSSPDAYEKVVDRLLASPRYGEHMARFWLDLARYSDTNGYHIDNERYMWRWRDWVIAAYNANQPYDQFTIEQLAGDLLPDATLDQKIASGFNRNHMINFEGGIIEEEYRVQYVVDRANTTGTVWLGLTVGCAQCHDHKYDPLSQKEYYELYSFFNTVAEKGSDGREGNAAPVMKAPLPEQQEQLAAIEAKIQQLVLDMDRPMPEVDAAQAVWEEEIRPTLSAQWQPVSTEAVASSGGATLTIEDDGTIRASGANPDKDVYEVVATTTATGLIAVRLEALPSESAAPEDVAGGAAAAGGDEHPAEADAGETAGPGRQALGRSPNGNFILSRFEVEVAPAGEPENFKPVRFVQADADFSQEKFPIAHALDGKSDTGWAVQGWERTDERVAVFVASEPFGYPQGSRVRVRLRHESGFAQHAMGRFRVAVTANPEMAPARLGPWYVSGPYKAYDAVSAYETAYEPETAVDFDATYEDGRHKWVLATPEYADGIIHQLPGDVAATYLYREIDAPLARAMELGIGSNDAVKIWVNDEVVLDNNVARGAQPDQDKVTVHLEQGTNRLLMKVVNFGNVYAFYFRRIREDLGRVPLDVERALMVAAAERDDAQHKAVRELYRRSSSPEWQAMEALLAKFTREQAALDKAVPTVMVMQEMETPRETFVLTRGAYDQPAEKVEPNTPAFLPPMKGGSPLNRLGLANWLVDPDNPLTARVAVNRFWQQYFGHGVVLTSDDFGIQGARPTHPRLLDWLAAEFVAGGWDIKAMQRLIVTSATYRQGSHLRPELRARDPRNTWLARGPRLRLDAEMLRDNALAISGLLVGDIGGPSVKPYLPKGLWEEVSYGAEFTAQRFVQDEGDNLFRRSMYTFWKRQSPPANMMIFDAPNREVCTAQRARTNTPLQALALMNDPQFVEAARVLAQRMLLEGGAEASTRIAYAFELATARPPKPEELSVLLGLLDAQLETFTRDAEASENLLGVGDTTPAAALDPCELAAYTTVASVILNLDETITKT
jgi:mono/diheme cytochrome c family protein